MNRAPLPTLWAAVVAEVLGFEHDEALTLGRVAVSYLESHGAGGGVTLGFKVVSWAHEHHSLMVTTNQASEEWTEILGSERLADAIMDWLTHRCHVLEANGESYRLRQARKRVTWKPSSRQDPTPKEKDN
jgi:hypothetical protein